MTYMPREALGTLLNLLLEAERAGAKLLSAYLDELPLESSTWVRLRRIQRDEARNCAVLIHFLLEADVVPGTAVGDFYRRGLQIRGWHERVGFLIRGQLWVAKRIGAAVPGLAPSALKDALQAMHDSHLANLRICKAFLYEKEWIEGRINFVLPPPPRPSTMAKQSPKGAAAQGELE